MTDLPEAIASLLTMLDQRAAVTPLAVDTRYRGDRLPLAVAVPKGRDLLALDDFADRYHDRPARIRANASFRDTATFAEYIARFRSAGTALFVDTTKPAMTAFLDFHGASDQDGDGPATVADDDMRAPSHCTHRASYTFPLSPELHRWSQIAGDWIDQETLANFLADWLHDIQTPPADWLQVPPEQLQALYDLLNLVDDHGATDEALLADLALDQERQALADEDGEDLIPRTALYKLRRIKFGGQHKMQVIARGISMTVHHEATAHIDPQTGERHIVYREEHGQQTSRAAAKVTPPQMFLLHIPVFEDEDPTLIPCRLSYRIKNGIRWRIDLVNRGRIIRTAAKAAAADVAANSGAALYFGTYGDRA